MYPFKDALYLIKTFEGFHECAFSDPTVAEESYSIGYGTTYYPDGTPVKRGHRCTKAKALEYLLHEINIIADEVIKLNLGLDQSMLNALVSFIHSIGWDPFLYSNIVDCCEREDYPGAAKEFTKWVFNQDHQVIGGLLDRRRKETSLFLEEYNANAWTSEDILLKAFRNYSAADHQVRAIRKLQECIDPYSLSEFANNFDITQEPYSDFSANELDQFFNAWE
jgi:lysozyme